MLPLYCTQNLSEKSTNTHHTPVFPFQFDSVADIMDVTSSVTLKSYTVHLEVPPHGAEIQGHLQV